VVGGATFEMVDDFGFVLPGTQLKASRPLQCNYSWQRCWSMPAKAGLRIFKRQLSPRPTRHGRHYGNRWVSFLAWSRSQSPDARNFNL
jgi:hypothetical protein